MNRIAALFLFLCLPLTQAFADDDNVTATHDKSKITVLLAKPAKEWKASELKEFEKGILIKAYGRTGQESLAISVHSFADLTGAELKDVAAGKRLDAAGVQYTKSYATLFKNRGEIELAVNSDTKVKIAGKDVDARQMDLLVKFDNGKYQMLCLKFVVTADGWVTTVAASSDTGTKKDAGAFRKEFEKLGVFSVK